MSRMLLSIVLLVAGCDDGEPALPDPSTEEPPAVPGATPATTTAPAAPAMLESASVVIDEQPYLLPPMVVRFRPGEGGAEVLLSGHERAEPTGHTLVLSMEVEAAQIGQLSGWTYQAPSDEWTDTPQGITLHDERFVLRPYDVVVRFVPKPADGVVNVTIEGTFVRFDTQANPELPGRKTRVEAQFDAALTVEPAPAGG